MSNENVARNETARQHTPGPWKVQANALSPTIIIGDRGLRIVARLRSLGPNESDALLIAASPDLLEAAVNVVGWYFDQIYDGPPGPQDDEGGNGVEVCIAELQEAIAKATGASR